MDSILEKLKLIPPAKRAALAAVAAGLVLAGWFSLRLMANSDFEVLYGNLSSEDAGRIVSKLKESKIAYKLGGGGSAVFIASDKVDEFRLTLASQGLPSSGGVGFELFDKTKLGVSGFAEKIQFRRALEGELARTLSRMDGVRAARVHLALPDPTPFVSEQAGATASIVMHLSPGASLSSAQIRGVVHLVSGAVEGLAPEKVSVIDGIGRLLNSGGSDDSAGPGLELKSGIEKGLAARGQELLNRLYGKDKALLSVDVALDMDKLQSVRESYDPDTEFVRSSRESSQKAGEGGAAGSTENQTSYELNKKIETFVKSPGGLKRISAAVLINGTTTQAGQVEKIKTAMGAALGIDEARGDKLTVETLAFSEVKEKDGEADAKAWEKENDRKQLTRDLIRYGSMLLSALIFAAGLFMAVKTALPLLAAAAAAPAAAAVPHEERFHRPAAAASPGAGTAQLTLSAMAKDKPEVFTRALNKYMKTEAAKGSPQKEAANVN